MGSWVAVDPSLSSENSYVQSEGKERERRERGAKDGQAKKKGEPLNHVLMLMLMLLLLLLLLLV